MMQSKKSKNLIVAEYEGEWRFIPPDAWEPHYDDLYNIGEAIYSEGLTQARLRQHRKLLDSIVTLFPDWVQAYLLLSEVKSRLGKLSAAIADAQTGVDICLNCFPSREIPKEAKISYYCIDNRPFFRVFHKRAWFYFAAATADPIERRSQLESGLRLSSLLLSANPRDNVGARDIAFPCALELRKYQKILKLTSDWEETACPETLYGRALAAFALKKTDLADRVIAQGIHCRPLVAKALLRPDIPNPFVGNATYTCGGADEALLYRDSHRSLWMGVTGAIDWLAAKQDLIADAEAYHENKWGSAFEEKSQYPDIYRLV